MLAQGRECAAPEDDVTKTLTGTLLGMALAIVACSGATAHTRSAYAVEVTRCIEAERRIVDRPGTTEAQDRADLRAERERCDSRLRELETAH